MILKIEFPLEGTVEISNFTFVPRVGEYVFAGKYPSLIVDKVTYDLIDKEIRIQLRTE